MKQFQIFLYTILGMVSGAMVFAPIFLSQQTINNVASADGWAIISTVMFLCMCGMFAQASEVSKSNGK